MPCPEVEVQRNHVQLATQFASRRLVNRSVEQCAEVEELLTKLHLDGKAVGVLQNLVAEAQSLRNSVAVVEIQGTPFAGQVVEHAVGLRFPNSLFHQSIEESHKEILAEATRCAGYAVFMIRQCASCGKKNRIPAEHLADAGRCGACKAPLTAVAEPIDADPQTFEEITSRARVPILVDFWAAWCGPCRMAAPEVQKSAAAMAGRAIVLKVDTERWPEISQRFGVMSIPNFVVIKNGRTVHQQPGLVDHHQMIDWLQRAGT